MQVNNQASMHATGPDDVDHINVCGKQTELKAPSGLMSLSGLHEPSCMQLVMLTVAAGLQTADLPRA